MSPKLLLIVDDREDNRVVLSAMLAHYGYNVLVAADGKEAVEQARLHAPALILMDLAMPVMDGWQATHLLKQDPETARIPVVALTAEDHTTPHLQEGGFCGYLRKSIGLPGLAGAVELCLENVSDENPWIKLPAREPPRSPR